MAVFKIIFFINKLMVLNAERKGRGGAKISCETGRRPVGEEYHPPGTILKGKVKTEEI
jgi:hypothetical protein